MADGRKTAKDFRRTFNTGDRPRKISFAAEGRYLPAIGGRAIAVKTMNVTNLLCETRPVPLKNIVQLMAREASCYDSFYGGGGDSSDAAELAGDPVKMAEAFRLSVIAGRQAYEAGLGAVGDNAEASSPLTAFLNS